MMILRDYVIWQWWQAPAWLAQLSWSLQRLLFRMFSVKLLIRTLLAPWRRDQLSYSHKPLQEVIKILSLNLISRAIGVIVRSLSLFAWLAAETLLIVVSLGALAMLIAAPVIIIGLIINGFLLLAG